MCVGRGHKHSSGNSIARFYISDSLPLRRKKQAIGGLPLALATVSPVPDTARQSICSDEIAQDLLQVDVSHVIHAAVSKNLPVGFDEMLLGLKPLFMLSANICAT